MHENIETLTWTAIATITKAKTWKWIAWVSVYFIDQFLLFDNFKLFIIVVVFWALDMIVWMISSYINHKFDYRRIFKGIWKLIVYLCYVAIWIGLNEVYWTWWLAYSIILWAVIIQESISIFEKFEDMWYSTPMRIKQYLPKIKDDGKNKTK
jgi:phage-related holin